MTPWKCWNYQPRILYVTKISFKNKGEIKTFQTDKNWEITRPALQEMWKKILQAEYITTQTFGSTERNEDSLKRIKMKRNVEEKNSQIIQHFTELKNTIIFRFKRAPVLTDGYRKTDI